jgi:hypothetical protein
MKQITKGDIRFTIDTDRTQMLYQKADNFLCNCANCINYTLYFSELIKILDGFDKYLAFDITKDLARGDKELQTMDFDDYNLNVINYYIYGEFSIKKRLFSKKDSNIIHFSDTLCATVKDISYHKWFDEKAKAFTISFEFKTPLLTFDRIKEIEKKKHFPNQPLPNENL